MILQLLRSLAASLAGGAASLRVLLTLNLPEPELETQLQAQDWPFVLELVRNQEPLGFGANHNQAFKRAACDWFVVINPDIVWPTSGGAVWGWSESQRWPASVGMLCPVQLDIQGRLQDYARDLMTPWGQMWRVACRLSSRLLKAGGYVKARRYGDLEDAAWVNGACMIFRAEVFRSLNGFDERYFMYCEDVDICLRLKLMGYSIADAGFSVVHDAQRNTLADGRHLRWHIRSLLRLWLSSAFWRYVVRGTPRVAKDASSSVT